MCNPQVFNRFNRVFEEWRMVRYPNETSLRKESHSRSPCGFKIFLVFLLEKFAVCSGNIFRCKVLFHKTPVVFTSITFHSWERKEPKASMFSDILLHRKWKLLHFANFFNFKFFSHLDSKLDRSPLSSISSSSLTWRGGIWNPLPARLAGRTFES